MQYFCLRSILLFSKSYPEIESTWPTAKCRGRKSFGHVILHSYYLCNALCKFFIKIENNVFPKNILKSKVRDQSIQARKKLLRHVIVKNYLWNVLWKFLIQIESTCRREIKEQAPQVTLLYRGRTIRSSHWRFYLRKLFLKLLQYPQETPVLESISCRPLDQKLY